MFSQIVKVLLNNMSHISNLSDYVWKKISRHKIGSFFVVIVLFAITYFGYKYFFGSAVETRYVTAIAQKGTLIVSVSGSGQVSAFSQIDLKPKASGDVIYIGVKNGQEIWAGTLITQLDARDAQKQVRDAENNLESAQISLEKLKQSSADLSKITEDSFNNVSNAFLDLPVIISDAEVIILGSTINPPSQSNAGFYKDFISVNDTANRDRIGIIITAAQNDYADARAKYNETFLLYKDTNRYADSSAVTNLLNKTIEFNKSLAQALKSEKNILDFIADYASANSKIVPSLINSYQTTLRTDIGKANGFISTLIDTQNSLKNAPLDIQSQELTLKQRENALLDAKETLADYFVRAPFAGIIASLDVKKGDSVSLSTVLGTLITKQKIAEISLNEVDVAKIKVGQKTTLTFDAIPDLTITGQVAEIDAIGTVSQGVVTYKVKIAFDTQDERIKTAMSASAAIITDIKQNVLIVPNSAVKSQGSTHYAEIIEGEDTVTASSANGNGVVLKNIPRKQNIETGLSNDESTEIIGGLKEGDLIVARMISSSVKAPATQSSSSLRIPGFGGGGGR